MNAYTYAFLNNLPELFSLFLNNFPFLTYKLPIDQSNKIGVICFH